MFVASYVNFGHRNTDIYEPYSNVRPLFEFRQDLARHFTILKSFPTSHNWHHNEPSRPLIKFANMHLNVNVPLIGPILAVEYFFICRNS